MALDAEFRKRLDEIRNVPKSWQNGERVFHRDDDVVFALSIADSISTRVHPAVFDDGAFWVYDDESGTWQTLERESVLRAAFGLSGARIFKKMVKKDDGNGGTIDVMDTYPLNLSSGRAKGISSLVETILSEPGTFAFPVQGLAFRNGFLVPMKEGVKLKYKSPSYHARTAMDFPWKEYPHPQWTKFLNGVFRDDKDKDEKQAFLQEFVGLALVGGSVWPEKALMLWGGGSNGKSVFLDIIQKIFPPKNLAAVPLQMWDQEYYRARLDGIALNVVSELPPREIMDSSAVKSIISGEEIEARRPRESPFKFRPKAAHLFAVNPPLPPAADLSLGFWRRWVVVSFNRNFIGDPEKLEKRDHVAALSGELKGVVTWAIRGAVRFAKQGAYTEVPSSESFLSDWRTSSDQVALFVREVCYVVKEPRHMMSNEELYRAYRQWGERTGHRMTVSLSRFCERLTLLGHLELQIGAQRVRPLGTTTSQAPPPESPSPEEPAPKPVQGKLFRSALPGRGPAGPPVDPEPT